MTTILTCKNVQDAALFLIGYEEMKEREPKMKYPKTGYRVDIKVNDTGLYTEYTSRKIPVTLEMAQSLAAHLKRGDGQRNTGGRIVEVPSGKVVESWGSQFLCKMSSGMSSHCTRCIGDILAYAYVFIPATQELLCDKHLVTPRPSQWDGEGNRVSEFWSELK